MTVNLPPTVVVASVVVPAIATAPDTPRLFMLVVASVVVPVTANAFVIVAFVPVALPNISEEIFANSALKKFAKKLVDVACVNVASPERDIVFVAPKIFTVMPSPPTMVVDAFTPAAPATKVVAPLVKVYMYPPVVAVIAEIPTPAAPVAPVPPPPPPPKPLYCAPGI